MILVSDNDNNNPSKRETKMTIKTRTVSTDPWKFAAVATDGDYSVQYIGDEGESRTIVKRKAARLLDQQIQDANRSRN
jgi:hypothetical protein